MNTGHDLFTLIHKGQRKELFAATVVAGTTNWEDPSAASNFVSLWSKLASMLEAPAWQRLERSLPLPHSCSDHTPSTGKQGS